MGGWFTDDAVPDGEFRLLGTRCSAGDRRGPGARVGSTADQGLFGRGPAVVVAVR